jgi:hypothetical protein
MSDVVIVVVADDDRSSRQRDCRCRLCFDVGLHYRSVGCGMSSSLLCPFVTVNGMSPL